MGNNIYILKDLPLERQHRQLKAAKSNSACQYIMHFQFGCVSIKMDRWSHWELTYWNILSRWAQAFFYIYLILGTVRGKTSASWNELLNLFPKKNVVTVMTHIVSFPITDYASFLVCFILSLLVLSRLYHLINLISFYPSPVRIGIRQYAFVSRPQFSHCSTLSSIQTARVP